MAKRGRYSRSAARHSREGWRQWQQDQTHNKHKSTRTRKWVRVPVQSVDDQESLAPIPNFESKLAALRPHPALGWGFRVVPTIVDAAPVDGEPASPKKRTRGRPRKRQTEGRALVAGDPAIDAGAGAMVPIPDGNTRVPVSRLVEREGNEPFSNLLVRAGSILATYDSADVKWVTRNVESEDGTVERVATQVSYLQERKPNGKGEALLERHTTDLSPGISRGIQRMIEDGRAEEARKQLDDLVIPLSELFEAHYPGAKVVAAGWHVESGQLHLDIWAHSTRLELVETGIKRQKKLGRLWDASGLQHHGPGPGICAWDRHVRALGEEAEQLCPGIVSEVAAALQRHEERAVERGRPGVANRDVRIHRRFDEVVSANLPSEYIDRGMNEYREHLRALYTGGGDPKLAQKAADPEKLALERQKLARTYHELRHVVLENREVRKREASIKAAEAKLAAREAELKKRERAAEAAVEEAETLRKKAGLWDAVQPMIVRLIALIPGKVRKDAYFAEDAGEAVEKAGLPLLVKRMAGMAGVVLGKRQSKDNDGPQI